MGKTRKNLKEATAETLKKKRVDEDREFVYVAELRDQAEKKIASQQPTAEDEKAEAEADVIRTMVREADAEMDRQNNLLLRGEIPEFTSTNQRAFKLSAQANLIKRVKSAKVSRAVAAANAIDGKIPAFRQNVRGAVKKTNLRSRRSLRDQTTTISNTAPKPKRGKDRDFSATEVGGGE